VKWGWGLRIRNYGGEGRGGVAVVEVEVDNCQDSTRSLSNKPKPMWLVKVWAEETKRLERTPNVSGNS